MGVELAAMRRARRKVVVGDRQRLFNCERCSAQVVICGRCDRGQRYCGAACAREARRESQRASNRRYQATPRGRKLHAERQGRYRRRGTAGEQVVTDRSRVDKLSLLVYVSAWRPARLVLPAAHLGLPSSISVRNNAATSPFVDEEIEFLRFGMTVNTPRESASEVKEPRLCALYPKGARSWR
jgi:hypothetical protein